MKHLKEIVGRKWNSRTFVPARYYPPKMLWYLESRPPINPIFMSTYAFDRILQRGEGFDRPHIAHAFTFDFDDEKDPDLARVDALNMLRMLEAVYDVDPGSVGIYYSGKKGFHVLLPVYVATSNFLIETWPSHIQSFCMDLSEGFSTCDRSVYDHRRILRIPGAMHQSGRRKIQLTFSELRDVDLLHIQQMATSPSREPIFSLSQPCLSGSLADKWQGISSAPAESHVSSARSVLPVQNGNAFLSDLFLPAANGTRNRAAASLVGVLAKHIDDINLLTEIIRMWNRTNADPLSDFELVSVTNSIYTTVHSKKEYQREFPRSTEPESGQGTSEDGSRIPEF